MVQSEHAPMVCSIHSLELAVGDHFCEVIEVPLGDQTDINGEVKAGFLASFGPGDHTPIALHCHPSGGDPQYL